MNATEIRWQHQLVFSAFISPLCEQVYSTNVIRILRCAMITTMIEFMWTVFYHFSFFSPRPMFCHSSNKFCVALWVMWGLLCGHLVAFKAPKSWPNKFLINVWGGFSVIFVASYTANIAALIAGLFFHHAASSYDTSVSANKFHFIHNDDKTEIYSIICWTRKCHCSSMEIVSVFDLLVIAYWMQPCHPISFLSIFCAVNLFAASKHGWILFISALLLCEHCYWRPNWNEEWMSAHRRQPIIVIIITIAERTRSNST